MAEFDQAVDDERRIEIEELRRRILAEDDADFQGKATEVEQGTPPPDPAQAAEEPTLSEMFGGGLGPEEEPTEETIQKGLSNLGAAAKDVARGVVSGAIPRGIAETPVDAVLAAADLGDWIRDRDVDVASLGNPLAAGFVLTSLLAETGAGAEVRDRFESFVTGQESTVTGHLLRETANFLTGMISVVKGLQGLNAAVKVKTTVKLADKLAPEALERVSVAAGRLTRDLLAGAAADIVTTDTAEATLSELVTAEPKLKDPVSQFLDGGGSGVEKRLRMALVGAGLGVAADTLMLAFRSLRGARAVRDSAKAARATGEIEGEVQEAFDVVTRKQLRISPDFSDETRLAADQQEKLFELTRASREKIESATNELRRKGIEDPEQLRQAARAEARGININWDRVDTEDSVKELVDQVTRATRRSVDVARRGVRTNARTEEAADILGLSVDDVLSRRNGQNLNAEESIAFRKVWISAAEVLGDLARAADDPMAAGNPVVQFKFRKMLATFHAINKSFLGARAEAGRALQSYNIKIGGDGERFRALQAVLEAEGGMPTSRALAKRINIITTGIKEGRLAPGSLSKIEANFFQRMGNRIKGFNEIVQESFVLGLLWQPSTHARNILSNSSVIVARIVERGFAAQLGEFAGREAGEAVATGEAFAMARGAYRALRAMVAMGAQGQAIRDQARTAVGAFQKVEVPVGKISAQNPFFRTDDSKRFGRAINLWGNLTRVTGQVLRGEDDFFKAIAFHAEVHAQAVRQSVKEGVERGLDERQIAQRMEELIANPPERIRLAAGDFALVSTFTNPLPDTAIVNMLRAAQRVPIVGIIHLPFVKTPVNIMSFSYQRTPFAPISRKFWQEMSAGGARRDIALSQLALGTMVAGVIIDWAEQEIIQGPLPRQSGLREAWFRNGIRAMTVNIPGLSFAVSGLDPFGIQVAMATSLRDVFRTREFEPEDDKGILERFVGGMALMVSETIRDRPYFAGISRVAEAIENPDAIERKLLLDAVRGLVPFSSGIRSVKRAEPGVKKILGRLRGDDEDELNEAFLEEAAVPEIGVGETMLARLGNAILSDIALLEDSLPRKKGLFGHNIIDEPINVLSPSGIKRRTPSPINDHLIDNALNIQKPRRRAANFGGGTGPSVTVNFSAFPRVYEEYLELAGHNLKLPGRYKGMGAEDFLNAVVTGQMGRESNEYRKRSRGPGGGRESYIRRVIEDFRAMAQRAILKSDRYGDRDEFVRFRDHVSDRQDESKLLRQPDPLGVLDVPSFGGIGGPQ